MSVRKRIILGHIWADGHTRVRLNTWICYVYAQELLGFINSVIDLLTLNGPVSGKTKSSDRL